MLLSVALDGPKRRNLRFYAGDDVTLAITVYARDGDIESIDPALITDPRIVGVSGGSVLVGTQFTVPADCCGRAAYRLVAEVDGITTTLAVGSITTLGGCGCCFVDYGMWCCGGGGTLNGDVLSFENGDLIGLD